MASTNGKPNNGKPSNDSKKTTIPAEWQTEDPADNGYSPSKFYTGSKDQMGHGTTYHVKFPDYIVPRLQERVQMVPQYKTVNDFVRDAVRHRLEQLDKIFDNITKDPEQALYDDLDTAHNTAAKLRTFSELPKRVAEACRAFRDAGDDEGLFRYVSQQSARAMSYPQPWRDKVAAELGRFRRMPD